MPYKNQEKRREYHREYMRKHPQILTDEQKAHRKVYNAKFRDAHKPELAEYQSKREQKPNRKLYQYRRAAEVRSLDFSLSSDEFNALLERECHYCGAEKAWGVDRKDNLIGYLSYNVVPCCKICNFMKRDMAYHDFISHIQVMFKHLRQ